MFKSESLLMLKTTNLYLFMYPSGIIYIGLVSIDVKYDCLPFIHQTDLLLSRS